MNVADAMTPRSEVVTVEVPGIRDDVLEYLQERAFSSVPVIKQTDEGEQFRGLVSRDALIDQPDEDQLALLVEEVPTTTADTSLEEVARVVEGEDDTGDSIANQDDDWAWEGIKAVSGRYMPTRNVEIPVEAVREFMTDDVVTVSKRRTAREAAQLMMEHDIEQIPLVSGDELVGIVRDVDLLEGL